MKLSSAVGSLPATVPFVAPEALERASGRIFRLRLGANESAFGVAPEAAAAMEAEGRSPCWYGDPESWDLRMEISARQGVPIDRIGVGAGIDDLLGLLVRALLDPGDVAVASLGSYPTFAYHVAGFGARVETVPYAGFRNDLDALLQAAASCGAKIVYLANPDNPTGSWLSADDVASFQRALPGGCLLVLDEAYAELGPEPPPTLPVDAAVRLRTFSKAYGMAGARIGYLLGPAQLVSALDRIRNHFGVNRIAQAGALASLRSSSFLASVAAEVARGRDETRAAALGAGLEPLPSATNFVAMDCGGAQRSARVLEEMAARGVFVRRPGVAPLDRLVRITVGTAPQRALLAELLRDAARAI